MYRTLQWFLSFPIVQGPQGTEDACNTTGIFDEKNFDKKRIDFFTKLIQQVKEYRVEGRKRGYSRFPHKHSHLLAFEWVELSHIPNPSSLKTTSKKESRLRNSLTSSNPKNADVGFENMTSDLLYGVLKWLTFSWTVNDDMPTINCKETTSKSTQSIIFSRKFENTRKKLSSGKNEITLLWFSMSTTNWSFSNDF